MLTFKVFCSHLLINTAVKRRFVIAQVGRIHLDSGCNHANPKMV